MEELANLDLQQDPPSIAEGDVLGINDGSLLGLLLGITDRVEDGADEGSLLGLLLADGVEDGAVLGTDDSILDGEELGVRDGLELGVRDGNALGVDDGSLLGLILGITDGV